jgi:prevent-host-death family protein
VAKNWQLQEAKNQFSTVVDKALTDGYQVVTRHGQPAVVVMSIEEFRRLKPRAQSLSRFLADSPLRDLAELPKRPRDLPRPIKL